MKNVLNGYDINIPSGSILFTDPCYKYKTWCQAEDKSLYGKWNSRIGFFQDEYESWSMRNKLKALELSIDLLEKSISYEETQQHISLYELLKKDTTLSKEDLINSSNLNEKQLEIYNSLGKLEEYNGWYNQTELKANMFFEIIYVLSFNRYYPEDVEELIFKIKNPDASIEDIWNVSYNTYVKNLKQSLTSIKNALDEGHPRITEFLHIKHSSVENFTTNFDSNKWIHVHDKNVGVDSGQAGFYDSTWYESYNGAQSDDYTYTQICNISKLICDNKFNDEIDWNNVDIVENGIASYTAHGDGSAFLMVIKDDNDNVIEAVLHYNLDFE